MSRQANPAMIGGFVVGALILGVITLLLLSGGQWFQQRQQHVLYFEGAAQGLQVGAPVVLLGVKVGTVKQIRLGLMQDGHTFMVPVTIEIEQPSCGCRVCSQANSISASTSTRTNLCGWSRTARN